MAEWRRRSWGEQKPLPIVIDCLLTIYGVFVFWHPSTRHVTLPATQYEMDRVKNILLGKFVTQSFEWLTKFSADDGSQFWFATPPPVPTPISHNWHQVAWLSSCFLACVALSCRRTQCYGSSNIKTKPHLNWVTSCRCPDNTLALMFMGGKRSVAAVTLPYTQATVNRNYAKTIAPMNVCAFTSTRHSLHFDSLLSHESCTTTAMV